MKHIMKVHSIFFSTSWIIRGSGRKEVWKYFFPYPTPKSRCLEKSLLPLCLNILLQQLPLEALHCESSSNNISCCHRGSAGSVWGGRGATSSVCMYESTIHWKLRMCQSGAYSSKQESPCCPVAVPLKWTAALEGKQITSWEGRGRTKISV